MKKAKKFLKFNKKTGKITARASKTAVLLANFLFIASVQSFSIIILTIPTATCCVKVNIM